MDNGMDVDVIFLFKANDVQSDKGDYDDEGNDDLRKEGDENTKEERARAGQVFQTIFGKTWTNLTS